MTKISNKIFKLGDVVSICHPLFGYKCAGTIVNEIELYNTHEKDFEILIDDNIFHVYSVSSIWELNDPNIKRYPSDLELDMMSFHGLEFDLTPISKEDYMKLKNRNLKVRL